MSPGAVAVVGANGFLGSAIARRLAGDGHQVRLFTRNTPLLDRDGAVVGELSTATTIYWAVSSINPWVAEHEPQRMAADLAALQGALDGLSRAGSRARLVYLSSGGTVYDAAARPPHDESTPIRPTAAYGRAKACQEQLVASWPDTVVLRVANAYGPGQPAARGQGVIGHWLRAIRDGQPIELLGSHATARDFVFVSDVADAVALCGRGVTLPAAINVGSGRATTLAELLSVMRTVCPPFEVLHRPARSFDVDRTWLDISLARRSLGWQPTVPLATGIKSTFGWLREDAAR